MRIVIVTGAFGALGQAVVADLVARGYSVVAIDKAQVPLQGPWTRAIGGVDLGDEGVVTAAYAKLAGEVGPFDALVNIVGGFVWEPVADGSLDSWDRMYTINLKTTVISTRAALPHFSASGAAIVNVGAAAAVNPGTGMAPYAASKAGVRALTESLAEELKPRRIRINAVLPTIIDTPVNRADMPDADTSDWVRPEAAARAIAFLISTDASAVTGASLPLSLAG